jgi:hypothetical protein
MDYPDVAICSPKGGRTLFNLIYMKDYEIIGWPEIQYFMDIEGFDDNATLIEENDAMGIDSSTYLVSKDWLESLKE